jgi:glycosyltransferase involved in cell wall biosynthesis
MKRRILLIIPAYNEQNTIAALMKTVQSDYPQLDILVIDDSSIDGTVGVLKGLGIPCVSLIHNLGYGGALETGYK